LAPSETALDICVKSDLSIGSPVRVAMAPNAISEEPPWTERACLKNTTLIESLISSSISDTKHSGPNLEGGFE
jgi:hypothetical protein